MWIRGAKRPLRTTIAATTGESTATLKIETKMTRSTSAIDATAQALATAPATSSIVRIDIETSADDVAANHAKRVTTDHTRGAEHRSRQTNHPLEVIMSEHAATPQFEVPGIRSLREGARKLTGYWWVLLVAGIAWNAAALVILQFDQASVTTVGVLVGLMFLGVGIENIALAGLNVPMRWAWALFGGLFLVSAVVCFANPTDTFAGLADMLGFLFLIAGVWSMVRAFLERALNPLWWMGLISGILLTGLAFWTSGQFFIHKAYVLLVFAGIWALMQGITSIVRAFQIRALHEEL